MSTFKVLPWALLKLLMLSEIVVHYSSTNWNQKKHLSLVLVRVGGIVLFARVRGELPPLPVVWRAVLRRVASVAGGVDGGAGRAAVVPEPDGAEDGVQHGAAAQHAPGVRRPARGLQTGNRQRALSCSELPSLLFSSVTLLITLSHWYHCSKVLIPFICCDCFMPLPSATVITVCGLRVHAIALSHCDYCVWPTGSCHCPQPLWLLCVAYGFMLCAVEIVVCGLRVHAIALSHCDYCVWPTGSCHCPQPLWLLCVAYGFMLCAVEIVVCGLRVHAIALSRCDYCVWPTGSCHCPEPLTSLWLLRVAGWLMPLACRCAVGDRAAERAEGGAATGAAGRLRPEGGPQSGDRHQPLPRRRDRKPLKGPGEKVPSLPQCDHIPSPPPCDSVPWLHQCDSVPSLPPCDNVPSLPPCDSVPSLPPCNSVPSLAPSPVSVPPCSPVSCATQHDHWSENQFCHVVLRGGRCCLQLMTALRDYREANSKLREYLDRITLRIIEKHPALLEISKWWSTRALLEISKLL